MPCVLGAVPSASSGLLPGGGGLGECHRNSTGSNSSQASSGFESMKGGPTSASTSSSSFHTTTTSPLTPLAGNLGSPPSRSSVHSSGSSSGNGSATSSLASTSVDALDDSHTAYASFHSPSQREPPPSNVDVTAMVASGVPEAEILAIWLDKLGLNEYLSMFLTQGYDLSTIARITPEDLTALGIASPAHRKRLIAEIHSWQITDSWPLQPPPGGLREWLVCLGLPEYISNFESQGYYNLNEVQKLCWEDFEDLGVKRLGHLKRLGLAIKKLKDYRQGRLPQVEQGLNGIKLVSVHPAAQKARPVSSGASQTHVVAAHVHQPPPTSHHSPPPPAPSSTFHAAQSRHNMNAPIDYLSYARAGKQQPAPPVRGTSTERPSSNGYGVVERKVMNGLGGTSAMRRSMDQNGGYDSLFETHEPIRLNLVKAEQILSEPAAIRQRLSSESSDYPPPPPAPLSCEGSIRRLQSISSACSSGSTSSSMEQLPFANDNCGTIRSREAVNGRPKTAAQSQPQTPRKALSSTFIEDETSMLEKRKTSMANGGGNVLNDIGYMLQNLTEELDAMLVPSKTSMPSSFPVTKKSSS